MSNIERKPKLLLGITGASGMIFLKSFVDILEGLGIVVHGICSQSGREVLKVEMGLNPEDISIVSKWFDPGDFSAPPSSGSSDYSFMAVLPCTMGTLASIAAGLSANLIHRAADVMLKERKKLVLAVRETPFNRNHLKNMLDAHDAGAIICPPMPSYYLLPKNLEQATETYSWRLADQLGITVPKRKRWKN